MQTMWDWLYDDQDIHPPNMTVTQATVKAMVKEVPFTWVPHRNLFLQNKRAFKKAL